MINSQSTHPSEYMNSVWTYNILNMGHGTNSRSHSSRNLMHWALRPSDPAHVSPGRANINVAYAVILFWKIIQPTIRTTLSISVPVPPNSKNMTGHWCRLYCRNRNTTAYGRKTTHIQWIYRWIHKRFIISLIQVVHIHHLWQHLHRIVAHPYNRSFGMTEHYQRHMPLLTEIDDYVIIQANFLTARSFIVNFWLLRYNDISTADHWSRHAGMSSSH